jgi:hypothetical protein
MQAGPGGAKSADSVDKAAVPVVFGFDNRFFLVSPRAHSKFDSGS